MPSRGPHAELTNGARNKKYKKPIYKHGKSICSFRMHIHPSLPHLSSFLLLPLAALGAPITPADEPPRPLIEEAIQDYYPHTVGVELTYTVRPAADGAVEVRCKVRRRLTEPTYEEVGELPDTSGKKRPPLLAECLRAGLLEPREADEIGKADSWAAVTATFDPRRESQLRGIELVREVEPEGATFESYGVIRAEKFVDLWELSAFEPRRGRHGKPLLEIQADLNVFREGPFETYVLGSKEWEELLVSLKPVRAARVERFERSEAALKEAIRPGSVYYFQFQSRSGRAIPARVEFGGEPGGPATTLEFSLPNAKPSVRSYTLSAPVRRSTLPERFRPDAQRLEEYRRAPDQSPEVDLKAVATRAADGRGALARLGDQLTLRCERGNLLLVDRSGSAHSVFLLLREPAAGPAPSSAQNGHVEAGELAWARH